MPAHNNVRSPGSSDTCMEIQENLCPGKSWKMTFVRNLMEMTKESWGNHGVILQSSCTSPWFLGPQDWPPGFWSIFYQFDYAISIDMIMKNQTKSGDTGFLNFTARTLYVCFKVLFTVYTYKMLIRNQPRTKKCPGKPWNVAWELWTCCNWMQKDKFSPPCKYLHQVESGPSPEWLAGKIQQHETGK